MQGTTGFEGAMGYGVVVLAGFFMGIIVLGLAMRILGRMCCAKPAIEEGKPLMSEALVVKQ